MEPIFENPEQVEAHRQRNFPGQHVPGLNRVLSQEFPRVMEVEERELIKVALADDYHDLAMILSEDGRPEVSAVGQAMLIFEDTPGAVQEIKQAMLAIL